MFFGAKTFIIQRGQMFQHVKKMSDTSASLLLVLLISADIVFIILHVIIGIFDAIGVHWLYALAVAGYALGAFVL